MEVKTGDAELAGEQVGRYLHHARAQGYAGVLTISNRITASPIDAAVEVDRRKLRNLNLWHLSWWRILTEMAPRQLLPSLGRARRRRVRASRTR